MTGPMSSAGFCFLNVPARIATVTDSIKDSNRMSEMPESKRKVTTLSRPNMVKDSEFDLRGARHVRML
jgi:hypothetical protein